MCKIILLFVLCRAIASDKMKRNQCRNVAHTSIQHIFWCA